MYTASDFESLAALNGKDARNTTPPLVVDLLVHWYLHVIKTLFPILVYLTPSTPGVISMVSQTSYCWSPSALFIIVESVCRSHSPLKVMPLFVTRARSTLLVANLIPPFAVCQKNTLLILNQFQIVTRLSL